jgi:osmotically-inducible protein OsmY
MSRMPILALTFMLSAACLAAQSDQEIQASVERNLHAYSLASIHTSVQHGAVTLTGLVNLCSDRLLADEIAARIKGVKAIYDLIEVSGPAIPDEQLQAGVERIIAVRLRNLGGFGYGSITTRVRNGVVGLFGTAAPELTGPAVAEIIGMQGVRNLVDRVRRVRPYDSSWRISHPPQLVAR